MSAPPQKPNDQKGPDPNESKDSKKGDAPALDNAIPQGLTDMRITGGVYFFLIVLLFLFLSSSSLLCGSHLHTKLPKKKMTKQKVVINSWERRSF
jgi:hypothetical protein